MNVVDAHAHAFENLQGLPAKKSVLDTKDLRERTLSEEALDLIRVAENRSQFE